MFYVLRVVHDFVATENRNSEPAPKMSVLSLLWTVARTINMQMKMMPLLK